MTLLYALLAGLALASALFVLFTPHVGYATLGLLCTLLSMAALYFLQGAAFVAVACVTVCGSSMLVILLFSTLMLPLDIRATTYLPPKWIIGSIVAGLWGGGLWPLVRFAMHSLQQKSMGSVLQATTVTELGLQLLGPYALAFEWIGLNLFMALVGTSYIMKNEAVTSHAN